MDKFMTQTTHQDEFERFLKILQIRLQEHQKAYDNFLTQIQKPISEILQSTNYTDVKPTLKQEQKPESTFTFRPS